MVRPQTILIDQFGINDPEYSQPITPDSEFWYEWLENHRSFRFLGDNEGLYFSNRFTANKDTKGYWTASRKIDGKLRRKRLGDSRAVSYAKLIEIAENLRKNYREFEIHSEYQQLRQKIEISKSQLSWLNHYKTRCQELEQQVKQLKFKVEGLEGDIVKLLLPPNP